MYLIHKLVFTLSDQTLSRYYLTLIEPCCINCRSHSWILISWLKHHHWRVPTTQCCKQTPKCLESQYIFNPKHWSSPSSWKTDLLTQKCNINLFLQ